MNLQDGNTPHRVAASEAARDGKIRRRVEEIYAAAARDFAKAPRLLSRAFRGARELYSHERRFVSEAVYGMIRWRRRLAFAALGYDDAPPRVLYLAWLATFMDSGIDEELRYAHLDPAALADAPARIAAIVDPITRVAVGESYPDWIVRRLADERGLDDTTALLAAMNRRAPLTARANRLKNTRDQLIPLLAVEKVTGRALEIAPDALALETHVNAYGLEAFKQGRFEIQDAGSQWIAEVCAPPPKGVVVDACAGAGGKTLALGALLANRGRLVALEPNDKKLGELRDRARRAGLTNMQPLTITDDPDRALADLPPKLIGSADRVLCDVPCSGLGVLRRNPEQRWRLTPTDLDELPALQRKILEAYAPLCKIGGRLIYATCSVTTPENDAIIDAFLQSHPNFEPVPLKEILGTERALTIGDGNRLRLLPHVHDTDGFFAAVLRRRA